MRRFLLLAIAMGLIVWIRLQPLWLPSVPEDAERVAREQLAWQLEASGGRVSLSEWIERYPDRFAQRREEIEERLRGELSFLAEDGSRYPYLGDYDSYLWLRRARAALDRGTVCDETVQHGCRDTHSNAPVGAGVRYEYSPHVVAILALHSLMTLVRPGFPLAVSAFWVPVLVGALAAIPTFALGRRLAGDLGGFAAAVVGPLNPLLLTRSIGSDNDVWNIALPLVVVWGAVAGVEGRTRGRRLAATTVAVVAALLHGLAWRGALFTTGIAATGLALNLGLRLARSRLQRETIDVRRQLIAIGALAAVLGLQSYSYGIGALLDRPWQMTARSVDTLAADGSDVLQWPDPLTTVGELAKPDLPLIAQYMDGPGCFLAGWVGLLLLFLPRHRWRWWHLTTLAGGGALYALVMYAVVLSKRWVVLALAWPLGAAALLYLLADAPASTFSNAAEEDREGTEGNLIPETIVALWFLSALFFSYSGLRFIPLLSPPFALVFGVAVGRLCEWVEQRARNSARWIAVLGTLVAFAALGAALWVPVRQGYAAARSYWPRMNESWWKTLEAIRAESSPEAIVSTWWDYGYFAAYVADRRVSVDGGAISTRIVHWIGRALLTSDEREAAGLLRMLNCGSDAEPEPEGRLAARAKLIAAGMNERAAYETVASLASRTRDSAARLLGDAGLAAPVIDDVLASTHCDPPGSYLVLSTQLADVSAWRLLGSWRPRPGSAAPSKGFMARAWAICIDTPGELTCPISLRVGREPLGIDYFRFPPDAPEKGRLTLRDTRSAPESARRVDVVPSAVLVARGGHITEHSLVQNGDEGIGILVDLDRRRVLVGTPVLLRSTFVRLLYLDDSYSALFERRAEHEGLVERVGAWKIRWDRFEEEPARDLSGAEPGPPPPQPPIGGADH